MKPGLYAQWMPPTMKCVRKFVIWYTLIVVKETVQVLGISQGSVSTILHDRSGMLKLTTCWVPKSLSDEKMALCCALLKSFRSKGDFLLRLMTVDEPKNKTQSSVGRA